MTVRARVVCVLLLALAVTVGAAAAGGAALAWAEMHDVATRVGPAVLLAVSLAVLIVGQLIVIPAVTGSLPRKR